LRVEVQVAARRIRVNGKERGLLLRIDRERPPAGGEDLLGQDRHRQVATRHRSTARRLHNGDRARDACRVLNT
jgi:hypothetical protein